MNKAQAGLLLLFIFFISLLIVYGVYRNKSAVSQNPPMRIYKNDTIWYFSKWIDKAEIDEKGNFINNYTHADSAIIYTAHGKEKIIYIHIKE